MKKHRPAPFLRTLIVLVLLACLISGFPWGPDRALAAAGSMPVRVGYYGETGEYRLLHTFTRTDMDRMCDSTYKYSNVTNVGTVMGTIARGVPVTEFLRKAGIDPASVKTLNFRTTDGTRVNNWFVSLDMDSWVWRTRYEYPLLRSSYDNSSGQVVPLPGSLEGKAAVPAILAIESYSTKSPTAVLSSGLMTEEDSYRFCVGQGNLTVGVAATEVTSNSSAKWIVGVDVTLKGTPQDASDLRLELEDGKLVTGGQVQIRAQVSGQTLFEDQLDGRLTWKSSDTSIATVNAQGLVTILKEGIVTITATTSNGISRQVVLNCTSDGRIVPDPGNPVNPPGGGEEPGQSGNPVSEGIPTGIQMREINLMPRPGSVETGGSQPLPQAPESPWAPWASAGAGLSFLVLGAIVTFHRYRKEV